MNHTAITEIATRLKFDDLAGRLQAIAERQNPENCRITLPLVGEFSAGKTTLINALTDSRGLETATKPTTATIYQVHFGCDRCHATAYGDEGRAVEYENLADLKNKELAGVRLVDVYDTSARINPSTVLVDTPGLSSSDPRHRQALVNFLPFADGILLVADINQQLTRSTSDFIRTVAPSKRPVYLVLTYSDLKSAEEVEKAKRKAAENAELRFEKVVAVAAKKGEVEELYALLEEIQAAKGTILRKVDEQRTKEIVAEMVRRIDSLTAADQSDHTAENTLRRKELELGRINRTIERLFSSIGDAVQEKAREAARKFEDRVSEQLETVVTSKSTNFDADAMSAINNTASVLLNEYKQAIRTCLYRKSADRARKEGEPEFRCLSELNLSDYQIGGLGYNLNLNEEGHQYDGWIATGTKVIAAFAAVYAAGSAAAGSAAAGEAFDLDTAADVADTLTDVGSMASANQAAGRIERAVSGVEKTAEKFGMVERANSACAQSVGAQKGIVESLVGFVTDKTWGKPQRRRAIHNYMDNTLLPNFKQELANLNAAVLADIEKAIRKEAEANITETTRAIRELEALKKEQHEEYARRMETLRDYKNQLLTI